jgi:hypothetical protein
MSRQEKKQSYLDFRSCIQIKTQVEPIINPDKHLTIQTINLGTAFSKWELLYGSKNPPQNQLGEKLFFPAFWKTSFSYFQLIIRQHGQAVHCKWLNLQKVSALEMVLAQA